MNLEDVVLGDRHKAELSLVLQNCMSALKREGVSTEEDHFTSKTVEYKKLKIMSKQSERGYEEVKVRYANELCFDVNFHYGAGRSNPVAQVEFFERGDWMDRLDKYLHE